MKKTIYGVLIALFIVLFTCTSSFAATVNKGNATMTLVEDNICNITFGQYGEFEKKMIECNTTEKYVDIRLTARNNAEQLEDKKADVILLIDSSRSMSTNEVIINGERMTRKEAVLQSAQTLVDKLLAANPNIQIGIVEFATSTETDPDTGYTIEGTDLDAKTITSELTNDPTTITDALNTVSEDVMGARTNLEVGLDAAYALLQTNDDPDTEKYIITLTDAIPNTARGVTMDTYSEATQVPTRNKILELDKSGVNLISMLIELSDSEIEVSTEDPKPTYKEVAEKIFGTVTAPTAGEVYYVSDEEVEDTVTNQIYASLIQEQYILDNIVIKDYFPQNIIDNFTYAQLTKSNIGEVTAEVNTNDNSITWTIPSLGPGEEATFSYRISLNDEFDEEIVGINLPTNENVEITYDENGTPGFEENDDCPIIALDVLPQVDIPNTGFYTGLYVAGITSVIAIIGFASYKLVKRNRF